MYGPKGISSFNVFLPKTNSVTDTIMHRIIPSSTVSIVFIIIFVRESFDKVGSGNNHLALLVSKKLLTAVAGVVCLRSCIVAGRINLTYKLKLMYVSKILHHIHVDKVPERRQVAQPTQAAQEGKESEAPKNAGAKKIPVVGRNDPCPCGSGLKYKKCHGKNQN